MPKQALMSGGDAVFAVAVFPVAVAGYADGADGPDSTVPPVADDVAGLVAVSLMLKAALCRSLYL